MQLSLMIRPPSRPPQMMPPPEKVEVGLGEKRLVRYTGCGLALGEEIDVSEAGPWAQGVDVKDNAARVAALGEYVFKKARGGGAGEGAVGSAGQCWQWWE